MKVGDLVRPWGVLLDNRIGLLLSLDEEASTAEVLWGGKSEHTNLAAIRSLKATNKKTIDIERQSGYAFVSQ